MLNRAETIHEPVEATIALLQKPINGLSAEEWGCLGEIRKILKPFNSLTNELSGEKFITVSKILIIIQGLRGKVVDMLRNVKNTEVKNLLNAMIEDMNTRFDRCEENVLLAQATCLDPRFKRMGFSSKVANKKIKDRIIREISIEVKEHTKNVIIQ